jgi:hypothetical protein
LAADYKFGDGWIATLELVYSQDVNALYHDNIGIQLTKDFVDDGGTSRPFYKSGTNNWMSDQSGNKNAANNVVLLRNTNKGYAFTGTAQIQKTFTDGLFKGLYLNASYTSGIAKGVTDGSSSVAFSAWQFRPAVDPNAQELAYSAGSIDGRYLASAFYTINWSKKGATNLGLIFQKYRPFRYSYAYNGDANGDGSTANDLIYIPKNFDEAKDHLVATGFADINAAWDAMNAFIEQDPYLSKNRGKYAERNGAVAPWANQLDFSIYHDIKFFQKNERAHTVRFSFDIANALNLVNRKWGVQETTVLGSQQYQFLTVTQAPTDANQHVLKYRMQTNLPKTFQDNVGTASRWQAVFGIKYFF